MPDQLDKELESRWHRFVRYADDLNIYVKFAEAKSILKEIDSWIRRRLRCYLWKQWGRSGYRELVKR